MSFSFMGVIFLIHIGVAYPFGIRTTDILSYYIASIFPEEFRENKTECKIEYLSDTYLIQILVILMKTF